MQRPYKARHNEIMFTAIPKPDELPRNFGATTLLCRNVYLHGHCQVLTLKTLQFVCQHNENAIHCM
jgi:hypothetical protein